MQNLNGDVSSDMCMNIWDTENDDALVQRCEHHTEFVVGIDFNIFVEGQVPAFAIAIAVV